MRYGGTPSWVYRDERVLLEESYRNRIRELKEIEKLRNRINELEEQLKAQSDIFYISLEPLSNINSARKV